MLASSNSSLALSNFDSRMQNVEVKFLFAEDALQNSDSANSQALHDIVVSQFEDIGLQKLSGLCTDGASVMVGKKEGLVAKLKRDCPHMINIHCVCHKLALACVNTDQELKFVDHVASIIRQLWQSMENSTKRTKAYMKTQMRLHDLDLSRKTKKRVFKKLKKACKTRWLSFNNSVSALYEDLPAVLLTLSSLPKSDAMAYGLLKNIRSGKFVATLYILHSILPHLAYLSMAFQKGKVNFGHIEPALQATKDALEEMKKGKMLQTLRTDLTPEGRLATISQDVKIGEPTYKWAEQFCDSWLSSKKRRRLPRTMMPTDRRDFTNEPEFEPSEAEPEEEMTKETEEEEMAGIEDQEAEEHSAQEAFSLFHLSPDDIRDKEDDDNSASDLDYGSDIFSDDDL
ncbi:hypothetical protein QZH41_019952 [Actinostola sp. cb2023]|nr:hypothetical protein QZH41_019952 [Actinostola sp. cb2023]